MLRGRWGSGPQLPSHNGAVTPTPQWDPAPIWSLRVHPILSENTEGSTCSTVNIGVLGVVGFLLNEESTITSFLSGCLCQDLIPFYAVHLLLKTHS